MSRPLIIAHRGASAEAPENTLPAFHLGIDAGADGVEFDVRLAKDGVPVVIHDRDLRRVAGRSEKVAEMTSAELAAVDIGSYFNRRRPKKAGPEIVGIGVPSLPEVLDLFAAASGEIHIELKIDRKNEVKPLVEAVAFCLTDSPTLPRVVVSSFHLAAIARMKFVVPRVRTSALFEPSILSILTRRRHMIALARSFDADGISPHRSLVTTKFADLAAQAVTPLTIWTCDNMRWIQRCRKRGIPALMTNDPRRLILARASDVE